jgi:hypothetical protein
MGRRLMAFISGAFNFVFLPPELGSYKGVRGRLTQLAIFYGGKSQRARRALRLKMAWVCHPVVVRYRRSRGEAFRPFQGEVKTVHELMKALGDYDPDTEVAVLDGERSSGPVVLSRGEVDSNPEALTLVARDGR